MPKEEQYKDVVKKERTTTSTNTSTGINYLLVIGIDNYAYCPTLFNAVKDAQAIVSILQDRYRFEAVYTTTLYNQAATKENIYNAFRAIKRKVTPKDNLLVYFSGHGEYDKDFDEGYWIPVEAEVAATHQYIANSEIKNILSAIPAHHTFLMADSCFSGSLFAKGRGKDVSLRKERDPSRWGLTAGRNEIVTDGKPGDNSPFAKSILYQLQHADQPLGVATLCDKVLEVVSANANQTPRGEPLKVDGHQGGQFVFHLKQNEVVDWTQTKKNNTIKGYESFLKQYPIGRFHKEAATAVLAIKATQSWAKIQVLSEDSSTQLRTKIREIHKLLTDFPNSIEAQEAENKGEYLHYKQEFLGVQNNLFALRKFARQQTPFQEAAKKRMAALEADLHKEEQNVNRKKKEQEDISQQKEQERIKRDKQIADAKEKEEIQQEAITRQRKQDLLKKEQEVRKKLEEESKEQKPPSPSFMAQYGRYLPLLLLIPLISGISQYMGNSTPEKTKQEIIAPKETNQPTPPISPSNGKNSGTFKDSRDEQTYQWLRLKDGKKWMAQNLNYKTSDSWCYENKESNCREYGRLYNWKAAKKACPNGWRLPSDEEWWKMASYYGKAYSSSKNNTGDNAGKAAYKALMQGGNSSFSAQLGGSRDSDGSYNALGDNGYYWSSTKSSSSIVWSYYFGHSSQMLLRSNYYTNVGRSCRCVQD